MLKIKSIKIKLINLFYNYKIISIFIIIINKNNGKKSQT